MNTSVFFEIMGGIAILFLILGAIFQDYSDYNNK